jgi:hypothetical protein
MTSPLILPYRPASYWSLSLSYTMYMMHTVLMLLNSFAIAIWIDCDVGSDRHTTTTFWNVCVPPLLYPIHISCTSIALLFGHAIIRWLYILKLGKSMSDIHQTCMNIEVLYRVIVSSNEYVHFLAFNRKHIRYHNSSQYPCAVQGLSYYCHYYYYYYSIFIYSYVYAACSQFYIYFWWYFRDIVYALGAWVRVTVISMIYNDILPWCEASLLCLWSEKHTLWLRVQLH